MSALFYSQRPALTTFLFHLLLVLKKIMKILPLLFAFLPEMLGEIALIAIKVSDIPKQTWKFGKTKKI